MTDSNETIAYENGRDAGYVEGLYDGATAFANYLKDHSFLCDPSDWHSFEAIDVDDLDDMLQEFFDSL